MVVPNPDGAELGGGAEVDLDPLEPVHEFDKVTLAGVFVAVGDIFEFSDDGEIVTTDDLLACGEECGAFRYHESRGAGGSLFELGNLDGLGGTFDKFGRDIGSEGDVSAGGGGGAAGFRCIA